MRQSKRSRFGRVELTSAAGWGLVLGSALWLSLEVVTTTYRSRDKFLARPSETEDALRLLVLAAVSQARMDSMPGEVVDAKDIFLEYEGLPGHEAPGLHGFRRWLDRTVRDGLTVRSAQGGYSLTDEGQKLVRKSQR